MVTLLLIISHFIGDFVLQSSKMAVEKRQHFLKLLEHCALYTFVSAAVLFISTDFRNSVGAAVIIGISHLVVDYARIFIDKKVAAHAQIFCYFFDQILHLGVIFVVSCYFHLDIHPGGFLQSALYVFGKANINNGIIYMLVYLVMLQPAAVTVKKVLSHISSRKYDDKDEYRVTNYNVGYTIGILERIIAATLVLQNQLSTVGLVLAAKSLARFNQLNDREFAEKYLVGTLTSIAISIIATLILKKMLL
ncbi:DUF3307 domain-containing protein [Clostridium luticellarii]|jgi:hypothetical protein|uniref:DUF3307 domain-containing protein n=1 Tax=Clostridium luticellarii TaxID=1691940 RepID=A0A2T0B841_9CLOT|nr:DUF3307 domain-containing protein [Clostridium luticellarii]MCI1944270.1 DUF3307 domain-containing protein [Clostridium luticellarii]MCI1967766.1 DUF3307 domain-containing protein [Clostridium luticellarii]MCI1994644.1 DUF3307 domain-containing protein [Clostridium luticellarii]MCI2038859.1 DUF3307 domain-containing protein [Clostridium luticellarii]PRR79993.1 hypothetical protein CLLU_33920 [Clostridium luticellarii]